MASVASDDRMTTFAHPKNADVNETNASGGDHHHHYCRCDDHYCDGDDCCDSRCGRGWSDRRDSRSDHQFRTGTNRHRHRRGVTDCGGDATTSDAAVSDAMSAAETAQQTDASVDLKTAAAVTETTAAAAAAVMTGGNCHCHYRYRYHLMVVTRVEVRTSTAAVDWRVDNLPFNGLYGLGYYLFSILVFQRV